MNSYWPGDRFERPFKRDRDARRLTVHFGPARSRRWRESRSYRLMLTFLAAESRRQSQQHLVR